MNANFESNRKLFYQEAGQWARHFSTVRMTVMTFTISTCSAIIALRGRSNESVDMESLLFPIAVLWIIGVLIFWVFTYHTYKQVRSQKKLRDWMPDGIHDSAGHAGEVRVDLASFVVPLFTLGLWGLAFYYRIATAPWQHAVAWGFILGALTVPVGIAALLKKTEALIAISVIGAVMTAFAAVLAYNGSELTKWFRSEQQSTETPDDSSMTITKSAVIRTNQP